MTRKYQGIKQIDSKRLNEVKGILEMGIGECEAIIPSAVLQDAIDYLEFLSYLRSWYGCSEDMGR